PHLYPSQGSTCCRYIDPPVFAGSVVWTTRMRGFLIEQPDRSRGTSMGLSNEQPGRSCSWAWVWMDQMATAAVVARAKLAAVPNRVRMASSAQGGHTTWLIHCVPRGARMPEGSPSYCLEFEPAGNPLRFRLVGNRTFR